MDVPEEFADNVETKKKNEDVFLKMHHLNNNNNNHHVVPVGVLIVLFTLYLTVTGLQSKFECYFEYEPINETEQAQESDNEDNIQLFKKQLLAEKSQGRFKILSTTSKQQSICYDLEIFTKSARDFDYQQINQKSNAKKATQPKEKAINSRKFVNLQSKIDKSSLNVNGNGNGNKSNKSAYRKLLQKNGVAVGGGGKTKKEQQQIKKNSTAEPIIYLAALVFIFLLIKAASDIHQHYKTQKKGDKRLRRCSLQSYAQVHKQDRRASKGISAKSLPKF